MNSSNQTVPNSNSIMFSREFTLYLFKNYACINYTWINMHRMTFEKKQFSEVPSHGLKWKTKHTNYTIHVKRSIEFLWWEDFIYKCNVNILRLPIQCSSHILSIWSTWAVCICQFKLSIFCLHEKNALAWVVYQYDLFISYRVYVEVMMGHFISRLFEGT